MTTSPATQEPCQKCGGDRYLLPEMLPCDACKAVLCPHTTYGNRCSMHPNCPCNTAASPSQRAELLTRELESAIAWLHALADPHDDSIDQVHKSCAAALLQHIAALQSEVTTAHARADDWHQRASQMLIDLTKAQRSVAALTQRVAAADKLASALQSGVHAYPNTAQGREMRHAHQQVIREYRALSQEPRNG